MSENQINQFINFMRDCGLDPANSSDVRPDGKWRDYQLSDDPKGKKKGFYNLKIEGDFISGACGDRRTGEVNQFKGKPTRELTDQERREWARRRMDEKKAQEEEQEKRWAAAAATAKDQWARAKAGPHDYLKRKGVDGAGTRVLDDKLLIPMYAADGVLWGVQSIDSEGGKLFLSGGRKKGCYAPLAGKSDSKDIIYICEGYATGASIRQATGGVVVVAFDAGNLKPVAVAMRGKYPRARLVICGDHDKSQTGQKAAADAAESVGGVAVWPDLEGIDWNDMAQTDGLDAVRDSVAAKVADREISAGVITLPAVVADDADLPPSYMSDQVPMHVYEMESLERNQVEDWKDLLIFNGDGKIIKNSLKNTILFLQHHEDFKGVFRLNDFQKEIYLCRCPLWESGAKFEVHRLEDNDIFQAAAALEKLGMNGDTERVFKAIRVAAEKDRFHPAREYFDGLQWDGVERLNKWLSFYLGAEDDDSDYLGFVGKKWLTAAVKRCYEPGCKFDHILVMEGRQGRGKSTAFEMMATFGRDKKHAYFTDNIKLSDIQNKDTILLLQGSIIVELAELAGFSKKEDDEIKGWITVKEDRCRVPYGKTITHFPRQFVLCATTNNYEYLKDPTGNRRYWPFKSSGIDLDAIKTDREQLWAEAVNCYKNDLYVGPDADEMVMAEKAQNKRMSQDVWEDDVLAAISNMGLSAQAGFNTRAVLKEMGLPLREQDTRNARRVSNILQQNGYENTVRRVDGKSKRIWVRS